MKKQYFSTRPTIGVLAGWQFYRTATNLSYLAPVFRGITRAAHSLGGNLLLGCGMGPSASPTDPYRPVWPFLSPDQEFIPIGPWNTDGLIIAVPLHSQARSDYVQGLIAAGHPILFVGTGELGPTIAANNRGGILEAMRHLVSHGHRQIAFIAGTVEDMRGDSGERLRAYQDGLQMYGLDQNPRLVAYGRHVYDGGYLAMQQINDSGAKYSAVLASNDESALGAMQALKDAGRRIPHDVAVIGFDNRLEGSVQEPSLTSIHVPLLNIGYRAVDVLLKAIQEKTTLPDLIQVDTHLVIRESCGCVTGEHLSGEVGSADAPTPSDNGHVHPGLASAMASAILNQAYSLTEDEGVALCGRLLNAFFTSIQHGDRSVFQETLADVLQRTAADDDSIYMWQSAISLLSNKYGSASGDGSTSADLARDLLREARVAISAEMQRQHQRHVMDERWTSSRLSLLTARLLTALDEMQIYEILTTHLSDMNIQTALLGLFEAEGDNPVAWSKIRNIIHPEHDVVRVRSEDFPPPYLRNADTLFFMTLIPLVDQSGQLGFMAFDTDRFDLYGAIVQQVGGALNTARLYREATEGRRLAEEANRMKSRFLSTISHELRTPLSLIVGLSDMVLHDSDEGDSPLPEPVRKDVDRIHTYAQHLGGLIGDVIDLATSDSGQLRLNNEAIELGQTLRMVAESGRQLATDKGLTWQADFPATDVWVWGDPTRLRQITLNLINNAIKFTSSGTVSMSLEHDDRHVTVVVRDTGLGISLDEQQVIFDEFRQSDRSVARGYGGLGLGLAISKRLVEMHGGSISVDSTGEENAGSTFAFVLPVIQPPFEQPPSEQLVSTEQTVAVVTNDPKTSERLCEHLHQRGFRVDIMVTEANADWRAHLDKWRPDAIVLDVSTDTALGWDALKEIKSVQALSGIPAFFFSSSQISGTVLELDYLTKPIEISELTRALDQHWLLPDDDNPTRTILVVDDEPSCVEMHARIVQSHSSSNRVLKARNGREALDILHKEMVDLILLDLQMPEMDGFEVLEEMRAMETMRNIPVIVVTGKALTENDMSRLNEGVAAVLGKGLFSIEETIAHIGSALEHKRKLSGESRRLVRLAMGYIHQNFAEAVSRRDIAQHVGITEDHLTFCFRQELGTTPITYLQRYRINQAKRLLKESQQTITEIASNVGFSDSGYFSRIFRRENGMSPEMFRHS
ncbi:MAG: substrate-binding domain-containing protein [Anaerolineae bacterium]|nr:substrate-binding domain-containing protein [Anaerolineae bacterium]